MSVAIMGRVGSYHDIAASHLFGPDYDANYQRDFPGVFTAVAAGDAEQGVAALENSSIGSLALPHELLIARPEVAIVDELTLRIPHALASVPGSELARVKRVLSHPAALGQCALFLESRLPEAVVEPTGDTAAALSQVAELGDPAVAAIGSPETAKEQGLAILVSNIANSPDNTTRFVVLQQANSSPEKQLTANRTMLFVPDVMGGLGASRLHVVTAALGTAGVPILGVRKHGTHAFFELGVGTADERMWLALPQLEAVGANARVIGTFKAGKTVDARRNTETAVL